MKKILYITALAATCSVQAAKHPSFSEIKIGFETIGYSEALGDVAGLGALSQSIDVTNPVIRQISYSGINESWGLYIDSAATISSEIETETWSIGEFGEVQENVFTMKANEIGIKAAYNWSNALQLTLGSKIYTSSFTRSHFNFVNPGATAFDLALQNLAEPGEDAPRFTLPGQSGDQAGVPIQNNPSYLVPVVAVSEDQMGILLVAGARYDSHLVDSFNNISWYAEGEISTPMYSRTQNTKYETTTLTENFNGWGASVRFGARYHILDNTAIIVGVDALYKERDAVTDTLDGGGRVRVPEIEYSNVSFSAGIHWSY